MILILICIVLLSSPHYAYADTTLEFKEITSKTLITYKIKEDKLIFTQLGQDRINLFDSKIPQFISFQPKTGLKSIINETVLNQRVNFLNQKRLEKLAQVELKMEEKLKTMAPNEQEIGESLINLIKYPEMYGEHTQLAVKKSEKTKQIHNITCQVYQLYRSKHRLKDFCMADVKSLKLSPEEYRTYRRFYTFDYNMQSKLMIAMGKTRFSLVDFEQQQIPGIVIESINYKDKEITQHLILKSMTQAPLDSSEFTLTGPTAAR